MNKSIIVITLVPMFVTIGRGLVSMPLFTIFLLIVLTKSDDEVKILDVSEK